MKHYHDTEADNCEVLNPTSVRAEVHGELAGVAAGVRADLAFKRPLVEVDA